MMLAIDRICRGHNVIYLQRYLSLSINIIRRYESGDVIMGKVNSFVVVLNVNFNNDTTAWDVFHFFLWATFSV